MTFLLSEISHDGVILASDSSEMRLVAGEETFEEVDKTLYFPALNVGISTWGHALVGKQGINEWLKEAVDDFVKLGKADEILSELTLYLADKLNGAFGFDGTVLNRFIHMGLHIAGYNSPSSGSPGICHIFIEPNYRRFDPQMTLLSLPPHLPNLHLRNGNYEEFAIMWPALSGIDISYRSLIASRYQHLIRPLEDPIAVRAEWLGSWVRQMCLVYKLAGIPEHVGKSVKVLTFDQLSNVRWFHLPEMTSYHVGDI